MRSGERPQRAVTLVFNNPYAMSAATLNRPVPSPTEIACRAYQIWEAEGRPNGCAVKHWLEAEAELLAELRAIRKGNPTEAKQPAKRSRYGLKLNGSPAKRSRYGLVLNEVRPAT